MLGLRNFEFWQTCLIESLKVKMIHSFKKFFFGITKISYPIPNRYKVDTL